MIQDNMIVNNTSLSRVPKPCLTHTEPGGRVEPDTHPKYACTTITQQTVKIQPKDIILSNYINSFLSQK